MTINKTNEWRVYPLTENIFICLASNRETSFKLGFSCLIAGLPMLLVMKLLEIFVQHQYQESLTVKPHWILYKLASKNVLIFVSHRYGTTTEAEKA
jgi:hypothetical protein